MKELGIYIHIPFCVRKCLYCDFVSYAKKENVVEKYIEALQKEILNWKKFNNDVKIKTIYIGGGTPSCIDSKFIIGILNLLDIENTEEITIEVNPGTINKEKLYDYKNAGINRLSIGLQSTNNELLKKIGRIHDYEQFLETYKKARKVGFNNINVDLMIGLPGQTMDDLKTSLEDIINLNPEHISVYSLILEDETPLKKMIENNILKLPEEDLERQMYWYVKDFLKINGYDHYEISNFAKQGFYSKHNMDCWEQKEYIGFGISAHSYIDRKRFGNISNLDNYIKNCIEGGFDKNRIIEEEQDRKDEMKEYMILGLRKINGISIQKFENKFNENPIILFKKELNKLFNEGLIIIDGDIIRLSNKGLDFANIVWEEFI